MVRWRGYSQERDNWAIDATERLLPPILADAMKAQSIEYAWRSDIDRLDKQYGVDALLSTRRRHVALAIRLRGRSYYERFGDITIRYESLQTFGRALEMQKSIARFMLYGWCDTDRPEPPQSIVDWHVIWLQRLVDAFMLGRLPYQGPIYNNDESSTFIAFDVQALRQHGLLLRSAEAEAA